MPIIQTNKGYGYVYQSTTKKQVKLPPILKFLLIILLIIVILFLAVIISSNIHSFIGINKNIVCSEKTLYAIKVGEFDDYNTANILSSTVKKQGGAGYIKVSNNKYYVLLSCYQNKQECLKVINNLIENNIEANLLTLKLDEIIIDKKMNKEEKQTVKNLTNSFYECYLNLYDLSLKYDQKQLTKLEICENLTENSEKIAILLQNFTKNYVKSENAFYVYLKVYVTNLIESLNKLTTINENFSAELKHCYFDVLQQYINFCQELQ